MIKMIKSNNKIFMKMIIKKIKLKTKKLKKKKKLSKYNWNLMMKNK